MDTSSRLLDRMVAVFQQRLDACAQRLNMGFEKAGFDVRQQVLHGQQRVRFGVVKPDTGQLKPWTSRSVLVEPVTALLAIVNDGGAQAVAHVLEVAFERGGRDAELLQQFLAGNDLSCLQQLCDLIETFGAVHGLPSAALMAYPCL